MPTTVAIAFPWGRYHANPWGRHINEGVVEWPPSPWRLLRALYAVWRCRLPEIGADLVEGLLASLAVPPTFALPQSTDSHTRHYLPDSRGGTDKGVDAFCVMERGAGVGVTWPVELDDRARAALAELASSLPYLGRAESICDGRLLEPGERVDGETCLPVPAGQVADGTAVRVLVLQAPLDLRALVARPLDVRRTGLLQPPGTYWQEYGLARRSVPPSTAPVRRPPRSSTPTAVRWALHTPALPSVRAAVAMTDVLRRACMSKVGDPPSEILVGKDAMGQPLKGHRHAHYLAFDGEGSRRLTHVVVWVPAGLGAREVSALARVDRLWGREFISDFRPARLGLEAVGEVSSVAPRLVGPSRRWVSHTPFAPPRHAKRGPATSEANIRAQIGAELERRGYPEPSSVRVVQGDWLTFRRHRTSERLADGRPAVGVEMVFPEPVVGPISLGALSHFGLGPFLPSGGDA